MRRFLLLLPGFLFILCNPIHAQQTDCNTTHAKDIDLEIKLLQARFKPIKISNSDSTAKYKVVYKEYRNAIQHFPHAQWVPNDCLQKYNNGDTLTYAQAVSFFHKLARTELVNGPINYGNTYLMMSYRRDYIGNQASRREALNIYFKRLEP